MIGLIFDIALGTHFFMEINRKENWLYSSGQFTRQMRECNSISASSLWLRTFSMAHIHTDAFQTLHSLWSLTNGPVCPLFIQLHFHVPLNYIVWLSSICPLILTWKLCKTLALNDGRQRRPCCRLHLCSLWAFAATSEITDEAHNTTHTKSGQMTMLRTHTLLWQESASGR